MVILSNKFKQSQPLRCIEQLAIGIPCCIFYIASQGEDERASCREQHVHVFSAINRNFSKYQLFSVFLYCIFISSLLLPLSTVLSISFQLDVHLSLFFFHWIPYFQDFNLDMWNAAFGVQSYKKTSANDLSEVVAFLFRNSVFL